MAVPDDELKRLLDEFISEEAALEPPRLEAWPPKVIQPPEGRLPEGWPEEVGARANQLRAASRIMESGETRNSL